VLSGELEAAMDVTLSMVSSQLSNFISRKQIEVHGIFVWINSLLKTFVYIQYAETTLPLV